MKGNLENIQTTYKYKVTRVKLNASMSLILVVYMGNNDEND